MANLSSNQGQLGGYLGSMPNTLQNSNSANAQMPGGNHEFNNILEALSTQLIQSNQTQQVQSMKA